MELQSVRIDYQMNVRAGNMPDQPASDEQLSMSPPDLFSTSNSSSRNSSPKGSPDHHHHTSSASSQNMSPSVQADDQINLSSLSAASSAQPLLRFSKEQAMKSLKESIPHSMKLQMLQKSEMAFQKDASSHKKVVRRLSKDLYMLVGLYALLQGALFTAVAQTSTFRCEYWWGPVGIACAVTLGTLSGALDKLGRMGKQKQEVKKFQSRQNAVYDKIKLLYWKGSACNIDDLEPHHSDTFDPAPGLICIFSPHGLLVLGFLIGFSALIIISCTHMLCLPCHC